MRLMPRAFLTLFGASTGTAVFVLISFAQTPTFDADLDRLIRQDRDIETLNEQIADKSNAINDIDQQIDVLQEAILRKQKDELTLESQIALIEDDIQKTANELEKSQLELDKLNLELRGLDLKIEETTSDMAVTRTRVGETLRLLYQSERKNPLEITLGSETLSDFFSEITYQKTLQTSLQDDLTQLASLNQRLNEQRSDTAIKRKEVALSEQKLEATKQSLEGERNLKDEYLEQTQLDEEKFQDLVKDAQAEQTRVNAEIAALEDKVQGQIEELRKKAEEKRNNGEELTEDEEELLVGDVVFSWPIDSREITCGFHCEGYPFARWFLHSGIDVRTAQGTPVRAAASGYVGIARSDGTSNLAWVTIEHGGGFSTVYMHLSAVAVSPGQFLHRGEVLGNSGGLPGTPGAGSYSTGAHLHFEVRVDGIAQDPLGYLP